MQGTVMTCETRNLLRRCATEGHWSDGVATVLQPARSCLYRARKAFRPSRASTRLAEPRPPAFSSAVPNVFLRARLETAGCAVPPRLSAEVDLQCEGLVRLAGERRYRMDGRNAVPGDAEDAHAYHRLYWAVRYACATAWGHGQALSSLTQDWAAWRQRGPGETAFSAYTCAERIASLVESLVWLDQAGAAAAFLAPWKLQIWRDARFLAGHPEYFLGVHNHLLNDARGLFLAARALPEVKEAAAWNDLAFRLWEEYFPRLILADGSLAERSSHYHLLLCRTALEYRLAADLTGRTLGQEMASRLRCMFRLAADLVREDGSFPRFGDSSPDRTATDLRGLLAAAWWHGLLDEAPRDRAVTPLTLYYCGQAFEVPPAPEPVTRLYAEGGFAFLRPTSAHPVEGIEAAIHADPCPEVRAHGDAGSGSFEVTRGGVVLIREPGSYLQAGDPSSDYSRGGAAQNVTCLNGLAPALVARDLRECPPWYGCGPLSWERVPNGLRFRSDAFRRLPGDIRVSRTWTIDPEGNLCFVEELEGSRQLQLDSRLHLGDSGEGDGGWRLEGVPDRPGVRIVRSAAFRITLRVTDDLNVSLEPGTIFPEYGTQQPCQVLHLSGRILLPYRWSFTGSCGPTSGPKQNHRNPDAICAA
jgi:heparinase II/III-like protein